MNLFGQDIQFWISVAIFLATFLIIFSQRVHRTVIALFGAVVMIVVGIHMGFYSTSQALLSIDFNTIVLLSSMMVIVAVLENTGAFQYLAIKVAKKTKGNPWILMVYLGTLTTLLSLILDNVTTIILIVPVTIIISSIIKINPIPLLLAEVFLSNVGGVATLVGDPPNIMIGSAAGFSFNEFLTHSLPIVFVAWILCLLTLRIIFRKQLSEQASNLKDLLKMNENRTITDKKTLIKTMGVLLLVIILFFLHSSLHIDPSLVAILGASLLLFIVSYCKDPQKVFEKIELSVLVFFISLFVIVGGLEGSGVLSTLAEWITQGAEENIILTAIIILWATAIMSAIVDNIPMTIAMIPIIAYLQTQGIPDSGILWWALVFGVGFGGNATPIGSTAGVLVISKSETTCYPITFCNWLKSGIPITIICLIVSTFALYFFGDLLVS